MKKFLYLLPIVAALATSCTVKNEVTGKLQNKDNDGKTIVLFASEAFDKDFVPIDSAVITDGKFSIERAATDNPSLAYLVIKNATNNIPPIIPFVNEDGNVQITIDSLVNLKGTPTNDTYQKFNVEMRAIDLKMYKLASSPNANIDEYNRINSEQVKLVYDYIKSNIKSSFGEFLLVTYASLLDLDQLKSIVNEATPELQAKLKPYLEGPNSENSNKFVGKEYVNISGNTPQGKTISLADYVGKNKVVLVDFWASWCGPCIQEMPNVVEAYKMYKNKGFEIVGVSLDENKNDWTAAIKKLDMTWPQMSDLKGWKSDLGAAYNVQSIPFTLLIDEKGNIIAENLRGDQLMSTLAKILD